MKRIVWVWMLAGWGWLAASGGLAHADNPLGPHASAAAGPVDCAAFAPPIVAYDIAKGQPASDVESFLNDLILAGFSVGTISGSIPACVDILIVQNISGTLGLPAHYTAAEAEAIKRWVDAGHALMAFSEWGAYRAGTEAIFAAFGYSLGEPGAVTDTGDFDSRGGSDWVIYQSDNFAPHPILKGVDSIVFPRSSWLSPSASAIVTSDANAKPPGVPVMAALASGAGCVVLSSDSNWLTDVTLNPRTQAGYFKRDNAVLARQAVSWLNGCGQSPTAWPGGPYSLGVGESLLLDGSASSDPDSKPLTYAWDLDGDSRFDDAFAVTTTFATAALETGIYTVALRVSNGAYTDTTWTRITVLNRPPQADSARLVTTAEPTSGADEAGTLPISSVLIGVVAIVLVGLVVARRIVAR